MSNFIDLIRLGKTDPEYLEAVLKDKSKIEQYGLTSAELEVLKKLDPATIKVIVESIEERIKTTPVASSQACSGGTFACSESRLTRI